MGPVTYLDFVVEVGARSARPFDFLAMDAVVKFIAFSFMGQKMVDVKVSWATVIKNFSDIIVSTVAGFVIIVDWGVLCGWWVSDTFVSAVIIPWVDANAYDRAEHGTRSADPLNKLSLVTVIEFVAVDLVREKPVDIKVSWASIVQEITVWWSNGARRSTSCRW